LWGDGGDDTLIGCNYLWAGETGFTDDTLHGGDGNDSLYGGDGADQMFGEAGNDLLWGDNGNNWESGGKGNDSLVGGADNDALWGGVDRAAPLCFTGGADTLLGGAGADWLLGGGDRDLLVGAAGNDTARGSFGNDTIDGGDDADNLAGGPDNDTVRGGGGDDAAFGDEGMDVLAGDAGNDELHGGDLNDTLDGGAGRDTLDGGAWWDTYRDNVDLSSPFGLGQSITDVNQEASPTCQTLCSIAAALRQGHDFTKQITSLGNNWYRVRLFPNGSPTDVNVFFDGTWTDNDAWTGDALGGDVGDYWVILLQRARLQRFGINWNTPMYGDLSWDVVNDRRGGRLFDAGDALQTLTGRTATDHAIAQVSWENVRDWLASGVML